MRALGNIWHSASENDDKSSDLKKMTQVSSSNSCLNNASLAGSYLSLMFCAFPKPLSQGSGLGLRVTSNDNLFVVICVQTTRDIQNSNTATLKKGKSIKKLSYLRQIFLSNNKGKNVKEKLAHLPHHSTCSTVSQFHISRMVGCKYTYPEPSMVPELCAIAFR